MKLTGKCKQDFEVWYLKMIRIQREDYHKFDDYTIIKKFYRSIPSMQWGVYQDWADSLGYIIGAHSVGNGIFTWTSLNEGGRGSTRQEAQQAAIAKFNEIYNER